MISFPVPYLKTISLFGQIERIKILQGLNLPYKAENLKIGRKRLFYSLYITKRLCLEMYGVARNPAESLAIFFRETLKSKSRKSASVG